MFQNSQALHEIGLQMESMIFNLADINLFFNDLEVCKPEAFFMAGCGNSCSTVSPKGIVRSRKCSALWGNTLTTALLHDQNRSVPFGLIVHNVILDVPT